MSIADPDTLLNKTVYDIDHEKVGKVTELYVDEDSHELTWAAISTGGLFGSKESMLPLQATHMEEDGLVVDLPKDAIKKAPQVDATSELTVADEETLLNFYNGVFNAQRNSNDKGQRTEQKGQEAQRDASSSEPNYAKHKNGADVSGPTTDNAMTRSEEQVKVGKENYQHHLRLKKYIVTEQQTVTTPVRKEKLRIEREPITGENRDAALDGPSLSEEQHDIVLNEEKPHLTTETVPMERVRMTKGETQKTHTEQRDVRKEQIGIEDVTPRKNQD